MSTAVNFHSQIASIMEVLANAAVAEICKVVDDGYAVVHVEMSRSQKENEFLRRKIKLLELQIARYRAERVKGSEGFIGSRFPGVRLLNRQNRDALAAGSSLQGRTRFLNRGPGTQQSVQKIQPINLDQDPDQEVVTTTKTEVHISTFPKNNPPQVTRCTVCCARFHCPLCPTGMYKPRSKAMVLRHLEVHKKNALQHEDFYITKCNQACRTGSSGHFHCPFCSKTTVRRQDAERHLQICRPLSILVEERPQDTTKQSDPIPDGQEDTATDNCSKQAESSLPCSPSLDNPPHRVLQAKLTSIVCHHCNVQILKKNMKKHIHRKHTDI